MKSYFTLFLLMLGMTAQAQFTTNNLAVLKISGAAIGNTGIANQTNIVELTTAGVATGTNINLTGGTPGLVVEERPLAHEGQLNLTADRNYITMVGYENAVGQTAATLRGGPKRVARISSAGAVDLSTNIQGGATFNFNGVSVRSAVSVDGSHSLILTRWRGLSTKDFRAMQFAFFIAA